MMPFPKIHDLYIGRVVLVYVLAAWFVVVGMDFMIGGVLTEMGNVGKGAFTAMDAVIVSLYTLPYRLYFHFPTAAVIGSLLALGQLAATSELTVMRALGLSRRRISLAVAMVVGLMTLVMMINVETVSPWAQDRAAAYRTARKTNDTIMLQFKGVWAREGDTFISATEGQNHDQGKDRWLELRGMRLYEFESNGRLKSIAYVQSGEHRPGGWVLKGVDRMTFSDDAVQKTHADQEQWQSTLDDTALASTVSRPRYMSTSDLKQALEYRERNQLDPGEVEEHYWSHWFYPLNVLALCLAAIPFAFGTLRSGGLGKRLFLGIVFAIGFMMLQTQMARLAGAFKLDFRIAYLIPVVVMLGISWLLFRRRSS